MAGSPPVRQAGMNVTARPDWLDGQKDTRTMRMIHVTAKTLKKNVQGWHGRHQTDATIKSHPEDHHRISLAVAMATNECFWRFDGQKGGCKWFLRQQMNVWWTQMDLCCSDIIWRRLRGNDGFWGLLCVTDAQIPANGGRGHWLFLLLNQWGGQTALFKQTNPNVPNLECWRRRRRTTMLKTNVKSS